MRQPPAWLDEVARMPWPPQPFVVHPREYAALAEAGEAMGFLPSSTIPRERDAYPLPAVDVLGAPHRPVLAANVLAAAAAACEPPPPPVPERWIGHPDAPRARPHYVIDPSLGDRALIGDFAAMFDVPERMLVSAGTYSAAERARDATVAWLNEMLLTGGVKFRLSEDDAEMLRAQVAEREAERQRIAEMRRAEVAEQEAASVEFVRQLDAIADATARVVLDLHAPQGTAWPTCAGCDHDGYDSEPPSWPCRTVEAVCEHHGVTPPPAHHVIRLPEEPARA